MNKWRLLLFAVFCIFQPISSESLFNGRERCLQQRPDFYRKDSRLLDHQANERSDIRVENRNGRDKSERINTALRLSERNLNDDEIIRSGDRRARSDDRIRVSPLSRQRITENENYRLDRRLTKDSPKLQNTEERRLNNERAVRNIRAVRSLSQESRRNNERDDITARNTFSRASEFEYAPNRRIDERFDDTQNRHIVFQQGRDLNKRRVSRSTSRRLLVQDAITSPEVIYDQILRRDDSTRRNNLQREDRGNVPDTRRQNEKIESVTRAQFYNEIRRQRTPATNRRVIEDRHNVQRRESDESRGFRSDLRQISDDASGRTARLNSRQNIHEQSTRAQRDVPVTRRNNIRFELTRTDNERFNRRSSTPTVSRTFERKESAETGETDESRQVRKELRVNFDRAYVRKSVESRDIRRELRDNAQRASDRLFRSDDDIQRSNDRLYAKIQRNIRSESERYDNAEISQRIFPIRQIENAEPRTSAGDNRYFRREVRNADRADFRYDYLTSRSIRRDTRHNNKISRRSSPDSVRGIDDRVEYLQRSRDFRRETRGRRNDDSYIIRDTSSGRTSLNNERNISQQRKSVERSDDTRATRRESRINSDIRFEDLAQRNTERVHSQNRRERQSIRSQSLPTERNFAAIARDAVEIRASTHRGNLEVQRNLRREIRAVRQVNSRRDHEKLNFRVQSDAIQIRTRYSSIPTLNVDRRQDNKRGDENRRPTRDIIIRDNKVTKSVRDEIDSRYSIRDNEMTKEQSLERTISMAIRGHVEKRIQRGDTSKRTRTISKVRTTFNQEIREVSQNNREEQRYVERRFNRKTPENYRYESHSTDNTIERNMERDSGKKLQTGSRRQEHSRRSALFLRDNDNSASIRDSLRKEIRLSMTSHDVPSEEAYDLSFKWQHLLYLLQAAYIVGLLAKLPQAKGNFEKKTRIGIWNHSPKLIKLD